LRAAAASARFASDPGPPGRAPAARRSTLTRAPVSPAEARRRWAATRDWCSSRARIRLARRSTAAATITSRTRCPARYWTLGLASPSGAPLANPAERLGYTSADIVRRDGGAFELVISRHARPGNWLSPGDANFFVLVLRLYETPLDTTARLNPARFLKIVKLGCE